MFFALKLFSQEMAYVERKFLQYQLFRAFFSHEKDFAQHFSGN